MHSAASLLLAFLAHVCAMQIAMHRELKRHLDMCITYAMFSLRWYVPPRRIMPPARFVLLFIAICAIEDAILPRESCGWLAIAAALIFVAGFGAFLSGKALFIVNCAIIGMVPRCAIANLAMLYTARVLYAILLSYVDRSVDNYCKERLSLRTMRPEHMRNLRDPNGALASKLRAMW